MWMVWLLGLFLFASPAYALFGFDEKYERDYNIFNPLNPINKTNPSTPFKPLNRPYGAAR